FRGRGGRERGGAAGDLSEKIDAVLVQSFLAGGNDGEEIEAGRDGDGADQRVGGGSAGIVVGEERLAAAIEQIEHRIERAVPAIGGRGGERRAEDHDLVHVGAGAVGFGEVTADGAEN